MAMYMPNINFLTTAEYKLKPEVWQNNGGQKDSLVFIASL